MYKPIRICHGTDYLEKAELKQKKTKKGTKDIENYMAQETVEGGKWMVFGKEDIGINGLSIEKGDIGRLFKGNHPKTNEKIATIRKQKVGSKTPPWVFMDNTLSAVKDFSILSELDEKNQEKYNKIFEKAKEEALKEVCANLYTRKKINGKNVNVYGLSVIIGSYDHQLSRPTQSKDDYSTVRPDMQKHAHNMIFKYAMLNGEMVAIENFSMYNLQRVYGAIFRAKLANGLREMGFEIEKRKDHHEEVVYKKGEETFKKVYINSFAVKGITDDMRKMFSKRSNEIEYEALKKGFQGNSVAKDFISQNIKRHKGDYTKEELLTIWKEDAKAVGLDNAYIQSLKTFNKFNPVNMSQVEEKLLKRMIKIDKKTKKEVVYDKNCRMILAEYEQYTGVDCNHLLDKWKREGVLKSAGSNRYTCTLDLSKTEIYEKEWKLRMKTNPSWCLQTFNSIYSLNNLIYNNRTKPNIRKILSDFFAKNEIKAINNSQKKKSSKSNDKSSSVHIGISHADTKIGIGYEIEELQGKARTLGAFDYEGRAKINAKIEELQRKIADLEHQEKNQKPPEEDHKKMKI